MPWNYERGVRQGKQSLADALDKLRVVTARKIRASYRAGKERVSGDQKMVRWDVEAETAFGVARRVNDLRIDAADADVFEIGRGVVGRFDLRRLHANPGCLHIHHGC